MIFSKLDRDFVCQYIQVELDSHDPMEVMEIETYIAAAKAYVVEYTGLTLEELDQKDYIIPPTLLLIADMHENKTMDGSKVQNRTFKSLLNLCKKVSL